MTVDQYQPPGPLQRSRLYCRTRSQIAARIGFVRKRVFHNPDIFDGILAELSLRTQLDALVEFRAKVGRKHVITAKAIETFCDTIKQESDYAKLQALSPLIQQSMTRLDAYGVLSMTVKEIKDAFATHIREYFLQWLSTMELGHRQKLAAAFGMWIIRKTLDTVPFVSWMRGPEIIHLRLILVEQDRRGATPHGHLQAIEQVAAAWMAYESDEPAEDDDGVELWQKIDDDSDHLDYPAMKAMYDASPKEPWREWIDLMYEGNPWTEIHDEFHYGSQQLRRDASYDYGRSGISVPLYRQVRDEHALQPIHGVAL